MKKERINDCQNLGLIFDGEQFIKDDINIHTTEILTLNDEEWDRLIDKIKNEISRREMTNISSKGQHTKQELGTIIDTMQELKDQKQKLKDQEAKIQEKFDALEQQLIEEMQEHRLEKAAGSLATATLKVMNQPSIRDKESFYRWVVRENKFEFAQARINAAPFRELFEQKNIFPDGVESYMVEKINMRRR